MRRFAAYGMAYHFASINNSTDVMIPIFKDAYLAGGGEPEHFQVLRLNDTSAAFWQHRPGTPATGALGTGLEAGMQAIDDLFAQAHASGTQHSPTQMRSPRPSPRGSRPRRQAQGRQGPIDFWDRFCR